MKKLFILFILGILIYSICQKEKSITIPKTKLIKGKETIQTVLEKLEPAVLYRLKKSLKKAGFTDFPQTIILLALKEERILQVYGKNENTIKQLISHFYSRIINNLSLTMVRAFFRDSNERIEPILYLSNF